MRNKSGQYSEKLTRESAHHFSAEGYAPFIKAPKGCFAQWDLSGVLRLEASGGLLSTPTSLSAIGSGSFRITPVDAVRIRVEY